LRPFRLLDILLHRKLSNGVVHLIFLSVFCIALLSYILQVGMICFMIYVTFYLLYMSNFDCPFRHIFSSLFYCSVMFVCYFLLVCVVAYNKWNMWLHGNNACLKLKSYSYQFSVFLPCFEVPFKFDQGLQCEGERYFSVTW